MDGAEAGSSSRAIDSSNVGFQLLKKAGWKEGTGLGVSEQGRLEPLPTYVKTNKRGLGAEKTTEKNQLVKEPKTKKQAEHSKKKPKSVSKRIRKMQEEEERLKEKEFERAFFREFWPDNV
ncbi:G patch domain and ankyrin repeat-containing protein 1 homolog isoform X2 [Asparagus officinalis]|uniref:G patch domain and ankyrin repeat-containing protein 1 homolog isoform X2 n=1 Tax=Asparagus officinalis TaxID=4686 RepID=UPI00098DE5DD|nr:G patch domain and ankyrin repeat-containing protein 1 homolog isoform X2 [Asparagus officinalis]